MSNINLSLTYGDVELSAVREESVNLSATYSNVELSAFRRENINLSSTIIHNINFTVSLTLLGHAALDPMVFVNMDKYKVKEVDNMVFDY